MAYLCIYKEWVKSNFNRWERPSIDRLINTKGYSLDNIQLVTFRENNRKSHKDAAEGKNCTSLLKAVDQFDLKGNFIATHMSMTKAAEATKQSIGTIYTACQHPVYHAKQWLWRYSGETYIPKYK